MGEDFLDHLVMAAGDTEESAIWRCASFGHQDLAWLEQELALTDEQRQQIRGIIIDAGMQRAPPWKKTVIQSSGRRSDLSSCSIDRNKIPAGLV